MSKQISKYQSMEEFESDLRQMLDNCRSFNGPGLLTDVSTSGQDKQT
jgi:predicted DNA binding CopG/RHH family protein